MTFGAGVLQKDLDLFTASHPLPATDLNGHVRSVPYHIPLSAHPVGSSIMLLGGFGFLSRKWGLSVDALVEAEVVLADGRVLIANEHENTGKNVDRNSLFVCLVGRLVGWLWSAKRDIKVWFLIQMGLRI